ncbi:prefoldin subunit alpha [Halococcus sediminicola]|uniref:prefoldin subunit alpha n=1 Tax=Halococcus sediminicola TaxID=1264579 RepID=UPI00067902BE|nr:prefoldin subunit alpha [Halococcus sediminicola]
MSMGGGGGGQLEQLSQELEVLEQQKEAMEGEIEGFRDEQREIDEATEALENLESGSTVQVPLGGDAYVRAEVQNVDETVVSLGGGYAAERDEAGAIETLERKHDALDDRVEEVREEITEIESERDQLEQQAQQLQQQQMQQLQGQMGGLGQEPESDDE